MALFFAFWPNRCRTKTDSNRRKAMLVGLIMVAQTPVWAQEGFIAQVGQITVSAPTPAQITLPDFSSSNLIGRAPELGLLNHSQTLLGQNTFATHQTVANIPPTFTEATLAFSLSRQNGPRHDQSVATNAGVSVIHQIGSGNHALILRK
jgi:hypothetical protein